MLDHACISVPDLAAARRFYDAVFAALGYPKVGEDEAWIGYGLRADATHPQRSYVSIRVGGRATGGALWAFRAQDRAALEAFRRAGIAAGGMDAPTLDHPLAATACAVVLLDPAGHRIAAVHAG